MHKISGINELAKQIRHAPGSGGAGLTSSGWFYFTRPVKRHLYHLSYYFSYSWTGFAEGPKLDGTEWIYFRGFVRRFEIRHFESPEGCGGAKRRKLGHNPR